MSEKPDYMKGARKWGCDMCPRGQRMKDHIELIEEELSELKQQLEDRTRSTEGDDGGDA